MNKIRESNCISIKIKKQKEQLNLEPTIVGLTKLFIKNNLTEKILKFLADENKTLRKQETEMIRATLHSSNHNFNNNSMFDFPVKRFFIIAQ